jgi:hypothetical protein
MSSGRANPKRANPKRSSPKLMAGQMRTAHNALKQYTSSHWGIEPDAIFEVDDPDLPDTLTQMGELLSLTVQDGGTEFVIDLSRYKPACHLAFTPDSMQRLYNVLTPQAEADLKRRLLVKGAPFYLLRELAKMAPGRQQRWPSYPDVEVQCLGQIAKCSYFTNKREDEASQGQGGRARYVHDVGEETGKFPLLGIDRSGRLWWAGGDYRVSNDGIVN